MVEEVLAAAAIVVGMVLPGEGGIMIGVEALEEVLEEKQVLEGGLEGHLMDLAGHPLHHPL